MIGSAVMKTVAVVIACISIFAFATTGVAAAPVKRRPSVPQLPGTPVKSKKIIIRERGEPPRWGYIGPHYKSGYGPGYHTNGPGIGIER